MKPTLLLNQAIEILKELNVFEYTVEAKKNKDIVLEAKVMKQDEFHLDLTMKYHNKEEIISIKAKRMDKIQPFTNEKYSVEDFLGMTSIKKVIGENVKLLQGETLHFELLEKRDLKLIKKSVYLIEIYWRGLERTDYPIKINLKNATLEVKVKNVTNKKQEIFQFNEKSEVLKYEGKKLSLEEYEQIVTTIQSKNLKEKNKRGNRSRILSKVEINKEGIKENYKMNKLDKTTGDVLFEGYMKETDEIYNGRVIRSEKNAIIIKLEEGYQFNVCKLNKNLIIIDNYSEEPFVMYQTTENITTYFNNPMKFLIEYFEIKSKKETFKGGLKKMHGKTLERKIGKENTDKLKEMFLDGGLWEHQIA